MTDQPTNKPEPFWGVAIDAGDGFWWGLLRAALYGGLWVAAIAAVFWLAL